MTFWNKIRKLFLRSREKKEGVGEKMCFCLCFKWCRILCLTVFLTGVAIAAFLVISLTRNPSLVLKLLGGG